MTLPLPLRNRLAGLILDSLHDAEARVALESMAALADDPGPPGAPMPERLPRDLLEECGGVLRIKSEWAEHAAELGDRSRRAWRVLGARPLDSAHAPLAATLRAAAVLFDAGLYFEVHELLEPHWIRAEGGAREALQGLIQIAVGFQHLANGNVAGARALVRDGSAKASGRRLEGLDLDAFARDTRACLEQLVSESAPAAGVFAPERVPRFPVAA
ncbi:MAG TPA: DUF309 domain-containing protein [Methylomirabilota bacterium]|nr:DUF309 domain-containing protein [Methylomirabilota bacterium]